MTHSERFGFFYHTSAHSLTSQVVCRLLVFQKIFLSELPSGFSSSSVQGCSNSDGILHKHWFPSEPSYCLCCVQFFEWRKCKETVVKDFLKSVFGFIVTNITVACYMRKSSLGQRPIKKVAPVTDDFFTSNCLALYYGVCSYKYIFKAVGVFSNIIFQHSKFLLKLSAGEMRWRMNTVCQKSAEGFGDGTKFRNLQLLTWMAVLTPHLCH